MLEAANYSACETLRDGRRVEIRALRREDRADLIAAVGRSSTQSLYRRFFAVKRDFAEPEIEFFLNVDFVDHVALVAVVGESGRRVIAGGARYVVMQPGKAEVAFAVVDVSGARSRRGSHASSRRDCPARRTQGTDRRSLAR